MGASIRESQIRLLTPDQKEMAECIGFEAYSKLDPQRLQGRENVNGRTCGKVRGKPQAYPGNYQKAAVKQECGGTTQWEKHRRNY